MPDRVKEAAFDMLGSHYGCPGALPALLVADVFAGSGSMGLEALSRGAASCCFFERRREVLEVLRRNLDDLGVGEAASIVTQNAWTQAVSDPAGRPFDLVFLDPPYRDSADTSESGLVRRYLKRLGESEENPPFVVLHHRAADRFTSEPTERLQIVKQRTFGTNMLSFFSA
jgi:16S rRNA (guanine(966)-N(2))-methyltransferase RsmD